MDRYELSVFRAAYYICKNRQDAEDVCQDTFLAYFDTDRDFESPEHIRAWLLRTAINKAKNVCRAFWRRNRESLDDHAELTAGEDPEGSGLLDAVLRLPVRCRTVMHLFYYEDYSVKETAELLGISENTVKSQLNRGRRLLKEMLREGWNDDES
jgi:RNA polymerase sigma-70 factor (ECF subfamily)